MQLNKDPRRQDLLWFGVGLPVFVAFVGWVVGRRTESEAARQAIWAAGLALSAVFWLVPASRRQIFVGFGYLTYPVGWVVTKVLLLVVFLGVVTPTALVMRLFGKDLLGRKIDRGRPSYWIPHGGKRSGEDYFTQS